jgi:hypothetical protein
MLLGEAVAECDKSWFERTPQAAKMVQNGDTAIQSLVGQMFCSGYGVISNLKKVTEVPDMYMSDHLLWTTSELSLSFSTKFFLQQNGILSLSSF